MNLERALNEKIREIDAEIDDMYTYIMVSDEAMDLEETKQLTYVTK